MNIPSNGGWSCGAVNSWLAENGLKGKSVLFDPGNADFNSVVLEAIAANPDTILVNLGAGAATAIFKVAQEQNLRDQYKWISPTPLYDTKIPAALGTYWDGKVYIEAEFTRLDGTGPDAKRWNKVLEKYSVGDAAAANRHDSFSQAGFISANIFVDTLLKMDPGKIDRASVTTALRNVKNYRTDLLCGPWYFGDGEHHMPNHAGIMLQLKDGGFKTMNSCFDVESKYLDPIKTAEKRNGLVGS
jgi:branched-chain amino acid transport system substrate-binding protein